jgi:alcohol dehydrogenase class IV
MLQSGAVDKIKSKLDNCNVFIFSDITPDPTLEIVTKGIEKLIEYKPEVMIALGGGSPIDAAKAIREISKNASIQKDTILIAIPTTSGTGSEVTQFSVITDKKKGIKYPLVSDELLPDIAILDPELVLTAPPNVTADTGMDVITHALEAYVSINASDCSDAFAEKSLSLAFQYLIAAYKDGNDLEAREKMHNASCIAGISFNYASLGLNHGIAHALGASLRISHGRANAMLLPRIIEYNADLDGDYPGGYSEAAKKYYKIAKILELPTPNIRIGVKNLIHEIKQMQKIMKMPATLEEHGVDYKTVEGFKEQLAEKAMLDTCTQTNPKKPTKNDVLKIISKIV